MQEAELGRQRRVKQQQIAVATAATEAAFSPLEHVDISWCEAVGGSEAKGEGEGEHDDDGEEVPSHWSVLIVSSVFEGVGLLDRHRAVLSAVSAHLQQQAQESSGDKQDDSSAVLLKVKTPRQWVAAMNTMMPPAEEEV